MWSEGTIGIPLKTGKYNVVHYSVKHYDKPSEEYGLDGSCISKLTLKLNETVIANYDRGWDVYPQTSEAQLALSILMDEYGFKDKE